MCPVAWTDLSLWTQQECLFRGEGVVPLVSVTLFHVKCCSVRSTLNICTTGELSSSDQSRDHLAEKDARLDQVGFILNIGSLTITVNCVNWKYFTCFLTSLKLFLSTSIKCCRLFSDSYQTRRSSISSLHTVWYELGKTAFLQYTPWVSNKLRQSSIENKHCLQIISVSNVILLSRSSSLPLPG